MAGEGYPNADVRLQGEGCQKCPKYAEVILAQSLKPGLAVAIVLKHSENRREGQNKYMCHI